MMELLAKSTGETLVEHTICCWKAAKALLASLPLAEEEAKEIKSHVLLAVAFHDLGKGALGFQRVLRGEQKNWGGKRHEVLSASFASTLHGISAPVLFAILTHHKSVPTDGITALGSGSLPFEQLPLDGSICPVWRDMADEWRQNLDRLTVAWRDICGALERRDLSGIPLELTVLRLAPAWLDRSSGRNGQRRVIPFRERFHASLVRGLTVASDHLGSAHLEPKPIPDLKQFSVQKHVNRPFQDVAAETQGSAVLRAPTGSGKTEAALLWARCNQRRNGRLFYVLPYTASINAMYRRLGPGTDSSSPGIFGAEHVGLLHSRAAAALYAMLEGMDDDSSRLDRQRNAKELTSLAHEMWFAIRVCTPHQVLRFVLRGKGWETMLAEFPNACFIYDEIHAYDPRVVGLTLAAAKMLMNWGARVLFLSATLPDFLLVLIQQALGEIPVITPDREKERDREILDRKRHVVEPMNGNLLENIEAIKQAVSSSPSTLIVCNHVPTAQKVCDEFWPDFGEECVLLHSRFSQKDRSDIENKIVRRPPPKVLIATQAIEVSLDIDFDQAFIEPAPIDALVQRMGRVNRAGQRESGPATVALLENQVNRHNLYCACPPDTHNSDCRVRRSLEELRAMSNPVSEADLVDAANRVYLNGYVEDERRVFHEGLNHPDVVDFEQCLLAGAFQDWVSNIIESTDGTVEVLPRGLISDYRAAMQKGLWVQANALLVPIRQRSMSWLRPKLDTSSDPWTIDVPYSSVRGLDL